tara:strand:+ start:68156 stop:68728 length:573 start_codon:yes stop_codon:yes gene_type:complete
MGLSTERKVFVGLACVAGLALIIDQGILGPSEASADSAPILADSLGDIVPIINSAKAPRRPASEILIDRLNDKVGSEMSKSFGSAFSLNQLVDSSTDLDPAQLLAAVEGEGNPSPDSFPNIAPRSTDLPTLSAVMPSKNGGGAVFDGKLLRVGDLGPNGYRLIRVHARSVIVEKDSIEYTIEIPSAMDQQ